MKTVKIFKNVMVAKWEGVQVGDFIPACNNGIDKDVTVIEITKPRTEQSAYATVILAQ